MSASVPLPANDNEAPGPLVLSAALEACCEGLAVVENGRVQYANQAFAQTFGFRRGGEVRDAALAELLAHRQIGEIALPEPAAGAWRGDDGRGLRFCSRRLHLHGRDWEIINVRPAERLSPRTQNALHMEAVGRLVSGVAHDFNNLLTGMLLYCDLLAAGLAEHPRLHRHVEEMRGAAERGALLIRQLLDVARPQPESPEPLSWNEAVNGLASFLRRLIGENISLVTQLAPDLGLVQIGPAQMQQVVLNLVLNARDAMPYGGRIIVSTRNLVAGAPAEGQPEKWAELAVADTGPGMDENTRARMFQPFFTTKLPGQGSGIGLATVHNIVQKAHGSVEVETAAGKGTCILVRLPQSPVSPCSQSRIEQPGSNPDFDSNRSQASKLRGHSL